MTLAIALVERGSPVAVPVQEWQSLNLEISVGALASQSIVRLIHSPTTVMILPNHHVGEMRAPGVTLRISPKSEALYHSMETLALRARSRDITDFESQWCPQDEDDTDPASAFVRSLQGAIQEGLPWTYSTNPVHTSFPRGRLDWSLTAKKLACRGVQNRVVAHVSCRLQDRDLARVVRAAHECLTTALGITRSLSADAELLMAAFDWVETFPDVRHAIAAAKTLAARSDFGPKCAELVRCSLALLSREYNAGGTLQPIPGAISKFRDLEKLWERCVLRFVEATAIILGQGTAQYHGLSGRGVRLFVDGGPTIDPDILVIDNRGLCAAVIDAKYKRSESGPAAADVYQMNCYLSRIGAALGILLYFNEEASFIQVLGTTERNALVLSASISPSLITSEGEHALARLIASYFGIEQRITNTLSDGARQQRTNGITNLSSDVLLRSDEYITVRK